MAILTNRGEHTKYFPSTTQSDFSSMTSYKSIYALRNMFRLAGGHKDPFNEYEMPGTFFFRLFFYFDNVPSIGDGNVNASNLLSTAIDTNLMSSNNAQRDPYANPTLEDHTFANSALNYLIINSEYERAELLLQFISLLSNINTYSPWYFAELGGVPEAIERKEFTDAAFHIEDTRRTLSIKCLPDAMDMRIGTLLDLYREICYSYTLKKEIVPANLRKFDMGIYLFSTPLYGISHNRTNTGDTVTDDFAEFDLLWKNKEYRASSKYLEFHNCEIDPNSSKTAYDNVSNKEGSQSEYTISLWYDSCYENRYNEFMLREVGDAVYNDMHQQAQDSATVRHVQGPISAINVDATSSTKVAQKNQSDQLAGIKTRNNDGWEVWKQQPRAYPKTSNLNEDETGTFTSGKQSISYSYDADIPSNKYKGKGWLQQNLEGVVAGVAKPLASTASKIQLGNIFDDKGMNTRLNKAKQTLDNLKAGSLTRSAIAGMFS